MKSKLLNALLATALAATGSLALAQPTNASHAKAFADGFAAMQAASSNSSAFQPAQQPITRDPAADRLSRLSIADYQALSSPSGAFRIGEPVVNTDLTRSAWREGRDDGLSFRVYQALSKDNAVFAN